MPTSTWISFASLGLKSRGARGPVLRLSARLLEPAVALLVLLAGAARARLVAADLALAAHVRRDGLGRDALHSGARRGGMGRTRQAAHRGIQATRARRRGRRRRRRDQRRGLGM